MALSTHLGRRDSSVRAFLYENLPNTKPVRADFLERLRNAPEPLRPPGPVHYGTIGMAIDYRIRYYFGPSNPTSLQAARGWRNFASGSTVEEALARDDLVRAFVDALISVTQRHCVIGVRLSPDDEKLLCRYCYVLALFEQLYRAPIPDSPLFSLPHDSGVDDLLRLASDDAVGDMRALSDTFRQTQGSLISREAVLNPTFAGSSDVGGADADLIVDGCLIELKTTMKPKEMSPKWPAWLYQVLGYTILDYEDRYAIGKVGVYLARQCTLMTWPLDDLIARLASSSGTTITSLRSGFRDLWSSSPVPNT